MNEPKFEIPDDNATNVEKISELFPEAVSEGKINFDMFRALFGDSSFENSPAKTNREEIFKLPAPNTNAKII